MSTFEFPPSDDDVGRIIQSWDFAVKDGEQNDYSVCITAHVVGNEISIIDIYRERLDYPSQRKALIRMAGKYGAKVILIEDAANGIPLIADNAALSLAITTRKERPPVLA